MNKADQKLIQYLSEAHAMERAMARVLQSQIAMAPKGAHRNGLQSHLQETYDHTERVKRRLDQLGNSRNPLQFGFRLAQDVVGQALALGMMPLELVRGSGGEEKVLKNAKDACATEALEIATYGAIERLANSIGDEETAALAASIRGEEQKMLDRLLRQLPALTEAVIRAELRGDGSYKASRPRAAAAPRRARRTAKKAARRKTATARTATARAATAKATAKAGAKRARQPRKAPTPARTEAHVRSAPAAQSDLPISNYDRLSAPEIAEKLGDLSQADLAKVEAYERKGEARSTVLLRIESLRSAEPWPGYDQQSVGEIRTELGDADEEHVKRARFYEQEHKHREGVLDATGRELSNA
jgi:ferritin-like metal-binding protein YciE